MTVLHSTARVASNWSFRYGSGDFKWRESGGSLGILYFVELGQQGFDRWPIRERDSHISVHEIPLFIEDVRRGFRQVATDVELVGDGEIFVEHQREGEYGRTFRLVSCLVEELIQGIGRAGKENHHFGVALGDFILLRQEAAHLCETA